MRGLFIKDLRLLKNQAKFFVMIAFIALALSGFGNSDGSFLIGYTSFISSMFVLSTISYDEFDNGNAFLFTLPFTKKEYVLEKYGFGFSIILLSLVASMALAIVVGMFRDSALDVLSIVKVAGTFIPILLIFMSIMLPFQLKFGGEKSRYAIFIVAGAAFLVGFGIVTVIRVLQIDIQPLLQALNTLGIYGIVAIVAIITILIIIASVSFSVKVVNKKEY